MQLARRAECFQSEVNLGNGVHNLSWMVKTSPLEGLSDEITHEIDDLPLIARLMMSKTKPPARKVVQKNPIPEVSQ